MNVRAFENGRLVTCQTSETGTPKSVKHWPLETTPEKQTLQQTSDEVESSSFDILVKRQRFLAFSLTNCPQCEELAAAFAARGVPLSVAVVKWEKSRPEYPAQKAALSAYAGSSFSFPQVFADGVYQGGYTEVLAKMEFGAYDSIFEEEFGAEPLTVKRWVEHQRMVVFSLPNCPQCDELRAMLADRGIPVDQVFIKWDKAMAQYQSLKGQLIQLTGRSQFTFPQTFVRSKYEGGFEEVSAKVVAGDFDDFFADTFGIVRPEPVAVPSPAQAAISFDDDF